MAPFEPGRSSAPLPDGVVLRIATEDDAAALAAIEAEVRGSPAARLEAGIRRSLLRDRTVIYVAQTSAGPAAYAKAAWLEPDPEEVEYDDGRSPSCFYLAGCTVHPAYRRRSLGRLLTYRRLDWIRERTAEAWYFANARNLASLALHTEFGFTEVRRGRRFHGVGFEGGEGVLLRADLGLRGRALSRSLVRTVDGQPG